MSDLIFEVTDPKGETVVCTRDCWENHILPRHKSLSSQLETVKTAIINPTIGVYRDAKFPDRRVYYYLQASKRRYLKVVAKEEIGRSIVVTAYETDSAKSGETLL